MFFQILGAIAEFEHALMSERTRHGLDAARVWRLRHGLAMMLRMAYDEDLANRIRELIARDPDVTEMRMFGGLAFLVGGNMSVAASRQGGVMVRVDPAQTDALLSMPHAGPFEMRGRPMQGWLRVDAEGVRTKRQLEPWVKRGVAYARSLPPKT